MLFAPVAGHFKFPAPTASTRQAVAGSRRSRRERDRAEPYTQRSRMDFEQIGNGYKTILNKLGSL
jgi:hypothetical protein